MAFPYFRLQREAIGGVAVVESTVGSRDVTVFWKAGTASALDASDIAASRDVGAAVAYSRRLGDRFLSFAAQGGEIIDLETHSTWNLFGRAVEGPLSGRSLRPLDATDSFWFDWAAFHPDTKVWQGS